MAYYDHWRGPLHIGDPIMPMVRLVKQFLLEGKEVRIFTARVDGLGEAADVPAMTKAIEAWCEDFIGVRLPVTNRKDMHMIRLYDDRAVQVVVNTGRLVTGHDPI